MAEAVFGDTPLAEYLQDTGMEDWGIEDMAPSEDEGSHLKPGKDGLYPLMLAEGRNIIKQTHFKGLIRQAVNPRLGYHEVQQFLEQFRYAIISSQLLESRPAYASASLPTDDRRTQLLFSIKGPWDAVCLQKKYFVGGGGCVVAAVVVLYWRSKRSSDSPAAQCAVIVTLLMGLYLYANSRRRLLRRLHAKALGHIALCVDAAKALDGDIIRALRQIQQANLIVNPTVPSGGSSQAAKKLRAVLSSALFLAEEALLDAIKDCLCMSSELDIQQYFEIYDVTAAQQELAFVMNDDFVGFQDQDTEPAFGPAACYTPLPELKQRFKRVHFLRRALFCCLLSVSSTGRCDTDELESWTVVCDHLRSLTDLSEQLSVLVTKERLSPDFEPAVHPTHKPVPAHDRALFEAGSTAQTLAARMEAVRSGGLDDGEQKRQLDLMAADLAHLNSIWQQMAPSSSSRQPVMPDLASLQIASPATASLGSDFGDADFSIADSVVSSTSFLSSATTLRDDDKQVFETTVNGPDRPLLSREERIKQMRGQRVASASSVSKMQQRDVFFTELENVLARRR